MTLHARTLELHGHRIAYRAGGDGPVLVLIHGMAGSSATWNAVLPALAERFAVVAPDLPGHGDSDKPSTADYSLGAYASTVRDLLVALGHERATLVGQSLGGGIAMQYTYQFPDRCERLVLVDSGGLGRDVVPLLRGLTFPGIEYLFPLLFTSAVCQVGNAIAGCLGRIGLQKTPHAAEMWRSYESLVDPASRTAFIRTLRSVINLGGQQVSAHDRFHIVGRIPTLIVGVAATRSFPSSTPRRTPCPAAQPPRGVRGRGPLSALRIPRPVRACALRVRSVDRPGRCQPGRPLVRTRGARAGEPSQMVS